jgi:hypothetical protein
MKIERFPALNVDLNFEFSLIQIILLVHLSEKFPVLSDENIKNLFAVRWKETSLKCHPKIIPFKHFSLFVDGVACVEVINVGCWA